MSFLADIQLLKVIFSLAFIHLWQLKKKKELNVLPQYKFHQKEVRPTQPCRLWAFRGVRGESFVDLKPRRQQYVSDLILFPTSQGVFENLQSNCMGWTFL